MLLLCHGAATAFALQREPTPRDYAVWNAIVLIHAGLHPVQVWHLVEPASVFPGNQIASAVRSFPEARPGAAGWTLPAAEIDIHKLRFHGRAALPSTFLFPRRLDLLDAATVTGLAGGDPKAPWMFSPLLLPDCEAVIRLSWPVYRVDERAAYVICIVCTQWWGAVIIAEVDQDFRTGKWVQGRSGRRDYANWKDGKCFIDEWP